MLPSSAWTYVAAEWQCTEVSRLNKILKKHGVDDVTVRKEICGNYFFDSGNAIDSESVEVDGARYRTQLVFLADGEGDDVMYLPTDHFAFHEYAFGDVDEVFETEDGA